MDEIWMLAVGFGGRYSVSNLGRIKRNPYVALHPGGNLKLPEKIFKAKPSEHVGGYPVVNLRKEGGASKPEYVHRLVLEAFKGPCPLGMECAHGDGNPANGRLDNLRWATPVENSQDKVIHRTICRGATRPLAKLTDEIVANILRDTRTQTAIAKDLGVDTSLINKVQRRVIWKHVTV